MLKVNAITDFLLRVLIISYEQMTTTDIFFKENPKHYPRSFKRKKKQNVIYFPIYIKHWFKKITSETKIKKKKHYNKHDKSILNTDILKI